jgi:predicted porin
VTYNLGEGFSMGGAMSSSKRTADQNDTGLTVMAITLKSILVA